MDVYAWAHLAHLLAALVFVGGVFFEVLVLSQALRRLTPDARREVGQAVSARAVRVMPWVVLLLFASGAVLVWQRYLPLLHAPAGSWFGTLLAVKIVLAFSVLLHFLLAVVKMVRRRLSAAWSKYIHAAVFIHMILIVFLAKLMFYRI